MAPQSPRGPREQEEEAYRAYLRAVKEYWTHLDVEALDLRGRVGSAIVPLSCLCYCMYPPLCFCMLGFGPGSEFGRELPPRGGGRERR